MKLKPEAFQPCIAKIITRAGVDGKKATEMLQETAVMAELLRRRGETDPFGAAARKLADELKNNAVKDRSDTIRNSMIRKGLMDDVHLNGFKNAALSLQSAMVNINTRLPSMKSPLEEVGQGMAFRWLYTMDNELRKIGMDKVFANGSADDQIAKELWRISQVGPKTPPKDAIGRAAFLINGPLYEAGERLRAAGAKFDHAIDYITRTAHDPRAMIDATFEGWWKKTEPRLHERTFENLTYTKEGTSDVLSPREAKLQFAKQVYAGLTTGIHGVHGKPENGLFTEGDVYIPPAFEGSRNIAKSHSHERVLYWNDSDSWMAHMREFGGMTSLGRTIHETLLRSSRHAALMERFGTNPMASLNMLIRQVQEHYRDKVGPEEMNKFTRDADHLRAVMGQLDGSANMPHSRMANDIVNTLKNIENASMLGAVGLTHFSALPITMSTLGPHYDISRFELFANNIKSLIQGAAPGEAQDILSDAGAFYHGSLAHFYNEFKKSPTIPGKVSAMAAMALKMTGLNYILENSQNGFRFMLMHKIGKELDKGYGDLNPLLRDNLFKYQIGEKEWGLLQKQKDQMQIAEGRRYATPKDFERLDDATIDAHNAPEIEKYKQAIETQRQAHKEADAREQEWAQNRLDNVDERLAKLRSGVEKRHAAREIKDDKLRDYFNDKDLEVQERMKAARLAQKRLHDVLNMGTSEDIRTHLDEIRQAMEGERQRTEAGEGGDLDELFRDISLEDVKLAGERGQASVEKHTEIMSKLARNYGRLSLRLDQRIRSIAAQAEAKLGHIEDMAIKDVLGLKVKYDGMIADVQEAANRMDARIWQRGEKLEKMEAALPEQIERLRRQTRWLLADNYSAFITHAGKEATVAAGARERAWAAPVTGTGALGKMMMQFKMWPLAVTNQVWGREWYANQSRMNRWGNLGSLLGLSMAGGMFRMAVRDASNGLPPRDPRDPKTMFAALMQGGGLSLAGDFVFGETNRMGGGLMDTLAGPVLGDAAALFKIFQKTRDDTYKIGEETVNGKGHYNDIWPDLLRFTKGHIPFANMIGLKGAMDYYIWNHMFEALSPGWYDRHAATMKRETGRVPWGYIEGHGPPK
jgi:hypothetical protein